MLWLILDGTFFWVFLAIVSIAIFGTVQSEKPGLCSFLVGGALVVTELFSSYHPLTFLLHDPTNAFLYVLGYAFAGIVWCLVKWTSYVHLLKDKLKDIAEKNGYNFSGDNGKNLLKQACEQVGYVKSTGYAKSIPPKPGENKDVIYMWIMFWPFSILGTIFDDPVRRFLRFTYARIHETLMSISNNAFKEFPKQDK